MRLIFSSAASRFASRFASHFWNALESSVHAGFRASPILRHAFNPIPSRIKTYMGIKL